MPNFYFILHIRKDQHDLHGKTTIITRNIIMLIVRKTGYKHLSLG